MRHTTKTLVAVALIVGAAACGGTESAPTIQLPLGPGDSDRGQLVYSATCAACHGGNAEGVDGLGIALTDSEFIAASSESGLVEFITAGRPKDHPENTTGSDMPRYPANPNLDEQRLRDVAAYLISLN